MRNASLQLARQIAKGMIWLSSHTPRGSTNLTGNPGAPPPIAQLWIPIQPMPVCAAAPATWQARLNGGARRTNVRCAKSRARAAAKASSDCTLPSIRFPSACGIRAALSPNASPNNSQTAATRKIRTTVSPLMMKPRPGPRASSSAQSARKRPSPSPRFRPPVRPAPT